MDYDTLLRMAVVGSVKAHRHVQLAGDKQKRVAAGLLANAMIVPGLKGKVINEIKVEGGWRIVYDVAIADIAKHCKRLMHAEDYSVSYARGLLDALNESGLAEIVYDYQAFPTEDGRCGMKVLLNPENARINGHELMREEMRIVVHHPDSYDLAFAAGLIEAARRVGRPTPICLIIAESFMASESPAEVVA